MGRFVYRFEDQSRPLGKFDGAAQTVKFMGRMVLATLLVSFLSGLSWLMAGGDPRFFMRVLNHHL